MPVYNVEEYIEKSIKSIIQQKKNTLEYELLIINDGSIDNSTKIAENLLINTNINYQIINITNSGVSSARNKGIEKAQGNYIFFLDSDDTIETDFMYRISAELLNNVDIVFWAFNNININDNTLRKYLDFYLDKNKKYDSGIDVLKEILIEKNQLIWTGSAVYSKLLLSENKLLFNEKLINGEDQEFIFSSLIYARKVHFIADTLSFYLIRKNSVSTTFKERKFDSVLALENVESLLVKRFNTEPKLIKAINLYIIDNFLYVYKSGLKTGSAKKMSQIYNNLETTYPGIKERVIEKMKNYKSYFIIKDIESKIASKNILIYGIFYKILKYLKDKFKFPF
nr:glycosyltransferase family A protein [Planococcus halocryophilus]